MKTERTELIAGGITFFVAAFIFYLVGSSSVFHRKADTYLLTARFNQTEGLIVGNEVRLAGIKIGHVVSLHLDDHYGVVAEFSVPEDILLPEDSGAAVQSSGLIGSKYIELLPGGEEDTLPPGGRIEFTQDSPDLFALLDKVIAMSKKDGKKHTK